MYIFIFICILKDTYMCRCVCVCACVPRTLMYLVFCSMIGWKKCRYIYRCNTPMEFVGIPRLYQFGCARVNMSYCIAPILWLYFCLRCGQWLIGRFESWGCCHMARFMTCIYYIYMWCIWCMIDMFDIFPHPNKKYTHTPIITPSMQRGEYMYRYCLDINLLPDAPGTKDYATFLPLMSHPIHLPEDPDERSSKGGFTRSWWLWCSRTLGT